MSQRRWTRRPPGSTWGDFGEDDYLGRLNLLTPAKVLQGMAEVSEGLSFCLSLPLDLPGGSALNPNRLPPVVRPNLRHGQVNMNYRSVETDAQVTDVLSDDLVVLHTQYSTQWDSFAHVGSEFDVDGSGVAVPVYYNGYRAGIEVTGPSDVADAGVPQAPSPATMDSTSSAGPLAVDGMARTGVQGRGVMVDLARHLGTGRNLVGFEELHHVMLEDGVVIEEGDILVLHTGFAQRILDMDGHPDAAALAETGAVLNGRDQDLLDWITGAGIAAIAADNYAVEQYPAIEAEGTASMLPLHEHCLFRLGVPLGELWYLTELARNLQDRGRSRFLLTAPPLRLPGAVGSPVTPVATL